MTARTQMSGAGKVRRRWWWRWRRLLFLLGLVVITLLGGAGVLLASVPLPPQALVSESTFLFDAGGQRLAVLHGGENRVHVDLASVPEIVIDAVLATEDRRFYEHRGLDPLGIARATWVDLRARGASQGGSTITQQYVKNVYLGSDRTLWRKLKEAALSVKLERRLNKDQILERYLNTIYWGRGAYGVQAAAKAWFDKDVSELGLPEAAYLAGLIRAPESADVTRAPEEAARRRTTVLEALRATEIIGPSDVRAVEAMPLEGYVVSRASSAPQVVGADVGTDYFVDAVRQELLNRYKSATVFGGGLRVYTTLDLDLQRQAFEAVYGLLDQPDDPAGALVAIDAAGRVLAMVGGKDFDVSKVNLALGTDGGGGGRQAGSAFKPFSLAAAVHEGISVESTFSSPPSATFPKANDGADWKVSNYEGAAHGKLNLVDATRLSSNTVFAQLVMQLGADKVVRMANQMGITAPMSPVPSITLGTATVSVLDMADAYLTLANRGVHVEPSLIRRVESADGRILFESRPETKRVLEESEADQVTFALQQVVRSGTGRGADIGRPVAGKTGTTQGFGDAWFVGYTRDVSVAVWMGYPEGQARAMRNVRGQDVTGGGLPAQIFRRFMAGAISRWEPRAFPAPRSFGGRVVNERSTFVDPLSTTTTAALPPRTTTSAPPASTPATSTPPASTTTTMAPASPSTSTPGP